MKTRRLWFLIARQEFVLAVRSRWTQIFAVVFGGLSLAVALSGYILSGDMACRTSREPPCLWCSWSPCWFPSRRCWWE